MKPLSRTFTFDNGKTLKVSDDGYEWCGKKLGRDECIVLDAAALLPVSATRANGAFILRLREIVGVRVGWLVFALKPTTNWIRCNWQWVKGS